MLLAMKTLNVVSAFLFSFCQSYNCRLFLSQIVGCPSILSSSVLILSYVSEPALVSESLIVACKRHNACRSPNRFDVSPGL